ncbi:putative alpha/beta hydrolase [Bradyrhizobium sp. AZCC 2176]
MAEPGLDDVFCDDITVPATDGYPLAATLFLPRGAKRHAVLINSATAVPRKLYRGFAGYLAKRGCAVLTYDYRGTGDSRQQALTGTNQPKSLVGFKASMSDWASHDITAAVAWMRARYKALPFAYVGHSFGGQALGLLPNNSEISRALFVAAQAGYWKLMTAPERYRVYALLNFVGLPLTRTLGYMPGKAGLGMDLPKDAFLQWVGWVMSPRYLFDDASLEALQNFPNYKGALRALCMSDDPWATRPAVELLCSGFTSIKPDIVTVTPADTGAAKIGHMGFFKPEHRDTLWRGAAEWIEAGCRCTVVAESICRQPRRHCERSEAIHSATSGDVDCFAALATTVDMARSTVRYTRLNAIARASDRARVRTAPPSLPL